MNLEAAVALTNPPNRLNTVAVDFDDTIVEPQPVFNPKEVGEPLPEGLALVHSLQDNGFQVVIFTARGELGPVKQFLEQHGFPRIEVTNVKPPAIAYIDNRGIRFARNAGPSILREVQRLQKLQLRQAEK